MSRCSSLPIRCSWRHPRSFFTDPPILDLAEPQKNLLVKMLENGNGNGEKCSLLNHSVAVADSCLVKVAPGIPATLTWQRKLNDEENNFSEFSLGILEKFLMAPFVFQVCRNYLKETAQGRAAMYNPFKKCLTKSSHGVPLGGIGAGSIGRSYKGYFQHWQLFPEICEESPVLANQFSVFVSRPNGRNYSTVLSPRSPDIPKGSTSPGIESWDWNLDGKSSSYHALYPRSWTVYDGEPDPEIKITCRQISSFIPHNYQQSSLPVSVFVENVLQTSSSRGWLCCHQNPLIANRVLGEGQRLMLPFSNSFGWWERVTCDASSINNRQQLIGGLKAN